MLCWHFLDFIQDYYQQIGRAGRDGKPCFSYLYFSAADIHVQQNILARNSELPPESKEAQGRSLQALKKLVYNFYHCRRKQILDYWGESATYRNCGFCDVCRQSIKNLTPLNGVANKKRRIR